MAYTINGKVYTEHPLMDEMVYNLGIIMDDIEIKNNETALECESEESLTNSDTYLMIKSGEASFYSYPFTQEALVAYGYDVNTAGEYSLDRNLIPEEDRDDLLEFCCNLFLENYSETNNYYRALMGMPWVDENEEEDLYYVYIDETYLNDKYLLNLGVFDFSLPLHEFTNYQIAVLLEDGAMDNIYNEYSGKKYKYLHFLGDKKLELYDIRRAAQWDILYMPSVETLVSDRFKELYSINRDIYLNRFYSEAYKISSDHYDEFMIIMLLCQTYADMICDIPEWYIRRDVFDLRSCQYFLESHGIEYFKDIPLKYQIRIVKNMNKLIRYKSTTKNFEDILAIFDMEDTTIYRYWIYKKRIAAEQGSYATGKDGEGEYELEFVKAPIGDTYDSTIKDNIYRNTYDDITTQDKYWDGQDTHELVYQNHLAKDFTIEGTKFFSIEEVISLSEYTFQTQYFFGLLFDSNIDMGDITISIPSISPLVSFPLSDLFVLLYCLTSSYDSYTMYITEPMDVTGNKDKPEFEAYDYYDGGTPSTSVTYTIDGGDPSINNMLRQNVNGGLDPEYTEVNQETFYEWLRYYHPELWMDLHARTYSFNTNADLEELAEIVGFRHSTYCFERGYTLEELGVAGFLAPSSITTIEDLVNVYETDSEIHDNLLLLIRNAQSRDEKVVLEFVYNYLFTKNYDYNKYTLSDGTTATTYEELLKDRNYVLYKYYLEVINDDDLETRQDMIRQAMNDIIYTLEYYLDYDCLNYIFGTFTTSSFNSMLNYIYLMINFFRSFKVYLLDPYVTYSVDNSKSNENQVYSVDNLTEIKLSFVHRNRFFQRDNVTVTTELEPKDFLLQRFGEVLDVYGHYEPDPLYDMNKDGGYEGTGLYMWDLNGAGAAEEDYYVMIDGKGVKTMESYNNLARYGYNVIGGTVTTEITGNGTEALITDYEDVDAGGVDFTSYIPYFMLNGGIEGIGLNMFDLDGASVHEQSVYVTVDGKGVDTRESYDKWNRYGYNVNGGHPDYRMMTTSSMIVRIIDRQISADVKILRKYRGRSNPIELYEDGLYISGSYASQEDVDALNAQIKDTLDRYRQFYNDTLDIIVINQYNATFYNTYMQTVLSDILDEAIYNYHQVSGDLLDELKEYTDKKADELTTYFQDIISAGLLGWDKF